MATNEEDPKVDPKGDPKQDKREEKKDPPPEKKEGEETVDELKAKLKAANEEAKKFRQEGKTAKEKAERLEKAWKIANGEDPDKVDPEKLEKQKSDGKMRKLMLKSAFVSVAASDMHDAEHSFDSVMDELTDVEVDLESGKVDRSKIKDKLADLKKARPYLFRAESDLKDKKKDPKGQKEDGQPTDGENPFTKWQNLFKKDKAAATKFYQENKAAITANWPK